MNKVLIINLRGKAYHMEEPGFQKLDKYLEDAKSRLQADPDKEEIIADLEQAIGEKLNRFLNPHKTVVLEKEADEVINEMGPVESSASEETNNKKENEPKTAGTPKRLYKIQEGSMLRGVCQGLAAYFDVDVVLVRIVFILLTVLTHGAGILIYLVMMIVVPNAKTSEEKAAASGEPFTAQEFINRARDEYSKFADKNEWKKWKREMKQKVRQERREWKAQYYRDHFVPFSHPLLGIVGAALTIFWLWGLITLISKGVIFGFAITSSIPLWAAILAWFCIYSFVMWPIKAVKYSAYYNENNDQRHYYRYGGLFETLGWLAFFAVLLWALWHYVPGSQIYFLKVNTWYNHIVASTQHR